MPISLILTPFDHFHFRPALAVKCIHDLRICHLSMKCFGFVENFFWICWWNFLDLLTKIFGFVKQIFWICGQYFFRFWRNFKPCSLKGSVKDLEVVSCVAVRWCSAGLSRLSHGLPAPYLGRERHLSSGEKERDAVKKILRSVIRFRTMVCVSTWLQVLSLNCPSMR